MAGPRYPGTDIPVRSGDLVRWHEDDPPAEVVFVISNGDFPPSEIDSMEWFTTEFGEGIMIKTEMAGLVLESEDCANITLVRSVSERAQPILKRLPGT